MRALVQCVLRTSDNERGACVQRKQQLGERDALCKNQVLFERYLLPVAGESDVESNVRFAVQHTRHVICRGLLSVEKN